MYVVLHFTDSLINTFELYVNANWQARFHR
jgi:hypothetical protein